MSLIIKGIDMPKNCDECIFADDYRVCDSKHDCPLIEIPKGHGRLIEDIKRVISQIKPHMIDALTDYEQEERTEAVKEWMLTILEAEE